MDTSNAATISEKQVNAGTWVRNDMGRVIAVYCHCGQSLFYHGIIFSQTVSPEHGTAKCRICGRIVRVPVRFFDAQS